MPFIDLAVLLGILVGTPVLVGRLRRDGLRGWRLARSGWVGFSGLVLSIRPGPEYVLNSRPLTPARLTEELRGIFASRPRKVLFVQGEESLRYGDVVHALDASRAAGVELIGIVPRRQQADL